MSLIEAIANVVVGYGLAVATQLFIFPLFGLRLPIVDNLLIGAVFTFVSLARSYALRRLFEVLRFCASERPGYIQRSFVYWRIPVARLNLKKMSVAALVAYRDEIQAALSERIEHERAELQGRIDDLAKLDGVRVPLNGRRHVANAPKRRGRRVGAAKGGTVKRRTMAPKYRGPGGETWTGQGRPPRWLAALEADGKKREAYLIKK